jgi:hypothetical protein
VGEVSACFFLIKNVFKDRELVVDLRGVERMIQLKLYQVWSHVLSPGEHGPQLHGVRSQWNIPSTEDGGAIQLRDKVLKMFADPTSKIAHVYIKEVVGEVDEKDLIIR